MQLSVVRTLLHNHRNEIIQKSDEIFASFIQIIQEQPPWKTKLTRIQKFKVTLQFGNPILFVKLDRGKWLRAAWKNNARKTNPIHQLRSAMRQAIWQQVRKWKRKNHSNRKCARCHQKSRLQADHKNVSFEDLCRNFLESHTSTIPVTFDYHSLGRKFQSQNQRFKRQWQRYHNKRSSFQWLCSSCNVKKKQWDQKPL